MRVTDDFLDCFHALGNGEALMQMKTLAMLLRPTFIADEGKVLVWRDWSNIEARVLPWLAASDGAEAKLDIFRKIDADKSLLDLHAHRRRAVGKMP